VGKEITEITLSDSNIPKSEVREVELDFKGEDKSVEAKEVVKPEDIKPPVKEEPKYDVPEKVIVNEFREKPLAELHEILDSLPIKSHTMAMKGLRDRSKLRPMISTSEES